jgi:PilZ domain
MSVQIGRRSMQFGSKNRKRSESRKFVRRYVRQGARVIGADGTALGSCLMHDISATGACLELKTPDALPDNFILLLSHDGQLRRQCSVVWRSETTIGVEFIPNCPATRSKGWPTR